MTGSDAAVAFRFVGNLADLPEGDRASLLERSTSADAGVRAATQHIVERVRREGDLALFALAAEFDRVSLGSLEVSKERCERALRDLEPAVRKAMERAARNIEAVHRASLPATVELSSEPGIRITRRQDPLGRVGVYAPGGRATYPSSVLMGAIPARVAGAGEVILCSPPDATGSPAPGVLAAAALAGVDRAFAVGGAGAIAAMAYGTASIPRVDRIVGPGNAYVAEAKLQVAGVTGIDNPAGPSELLVLADESVPARTIALEMLAQAEHDPMASVILVAIGEPVAQAVTLEINALVGAAPRNAIIRASFKSRGAMLVTGSVADAVRFSNDFAPEHLMLAVAEADTLAAKCRNAGTIFLGGASSVAFGDYMTGANHVLPTGGLARSYSGLSVLDFIRWTTVQTVQPSAARSLAEDVGVFADSEGLPSHAAAARQWVGDAS